MALLIPSIGSFPRGAQPGERRLAQRLEQLLDEDTTVWFDVPLGHRSRHPDFTLLNARRGLTILEVKDWRLSTIQSINRFRATLLLDRGIVETENPYEQARQCAQQLMGVLERDPQLVYPADAARYAGRLRFPVGFGVVLTNITRRQFATETNLADVLPPDKVICKDEMTETADAGEFAERLWAMQQFTPTVLSLPQLERIRWHIFPEVRIDGAQSSLGFDDEQSVPANARPLPDIMRVMDMAQEQLARSLGEGHRVIHGAAGSGKTLILIYRALQVTEASVKPVLVLCFNKPLARKINAAISLRADPAARARLTVLNYHAWIREQLRTYSQVPKARGDAIYAVLERAFQRGVETGLIPSGQYSSVLIDEGQDFKPEWLNSVVKMVDPGTQSLLLMYDDAQAIYHKQKRKQSLASLGIQASGRTTILRVNYRNTSDILAFAWNFARELFAPDSEAADGDMPLVKPQTGGRHGPRPQLLRFDTLKAERAYLIERLRAAHAGGRPWSEIAVFLAYRSDVELIERSIDEAGIPRATVEHSAGVHVDTLAACKGLEYPVVVLPLLQKLPRAQVKDDLEEARLLYVGFTRATEELVLTCSGESAFTRKLGTKKVTA